MDKILMVRHGQSLANVMNIYCGGETPLTEEGKAMLEESRERIEKLDFSHFVTSPYLRTRQTTEILNRRLQKPVVVEPLIHEMDTGILNGLTDPEAWERYPEVMEGLKTSFDYQIPQGESMAQVYQRAVQFLDNCRQGKYGEKPIFVSHATFMNNVMLAAGLVEMGDPEVLIQNGELVEIPLPAYAAEAI